jgi:hypothetical protein
MLRTNSSSSCGSHQESYSAARDASNTNNCLQECVSDSKDTWLHQAPPYDLSQMNDDLLEFTHSNDSNNSNGSNDSMSAFLHLAAPFDPNQLDDNLLASTDSSTDKDAWLHQAPPFFDLQDMDDDLLCGMIS